MRAAYRQDVKGFRGAGHAISIFKFASKARLPALTGQSTKAIRIASAPFGTASLTAFYMAIEKQK
jgi:hypothetical protein